jgi:ABC-type molybdate transport system substrate-binding protein
MLYEESSAECVFTLHFFAVLMIGLCVAKGGAVERRITAFCGSAGKPAMEEAASQFKQVTGIRADLHFSG